MMTVLGIFFALLIGTLAGMLLMEKTDSYDEMDDMDNENYWL